MKELNDIASNYGTDKLSHGFTDVYKRHFEGIRTKIKSVLEIGVYEGQSLQMWRDYFPKASIVGWDIKEYPKGSFGHRTTTLKMDQSNPNSLSQALSSIPIETQFDVIIDDGSHRMKDQQITISMLWDKLKIGGYYIIEDLHTALPNNKHEWKGGGCREDFSNSTLKLLERLQSNEPLLSVYMDKYSCKRISESVEFCKIYDTKADERHITSVIRKKEAHAKTKKVKGYIHIALMNGHQGMLIATEIHGRILESGLYDRSEIINLSILYDDPWQFEYLKAQLWDVYPKYSIRRAVQNLKLWEWPILSDIKKDSKKEKQEYYAWYMHTKGVSNCRNGIPPRTQNNIRNWRNSMFAGMTCHKKIIGMLDTGNTAVGPFLRDEATKPKYFRGNFWWASSTHIKQLPDITPIMETNRNLSEGWIGNLKDTSKMCSSTPKTLLFDLYDFKNTLGSDGPFLGIPGNIMLQENDQTNREKKPLCLNIGCNDIHIKGFTNIDINPRVKPDIVADATKIKDIFSKNSVDFIYMGHFLEHITIIEGENLIKDIFYILKEFGSIAAVIPDYTKIPVGTPIIDTERVIMGAGSHKILMDTKRLKTYFKKADFNSVIETKLNEMDYCPFPNVIWQSCVVAIKHPKAKFYNKNL